MIFCFLSKSRLISLILFNVFLTDVESGSCEYKSALISSVVIAQITDANSAGERFSNTPEKIILAKNNSFSERN